MTAAETLSFSPALNRFLEEGSDEDNDDEDQVPAALGLGVLDFTTQDTSLRGRTRIFLTEISLKKVDSLKRSEMQGRR